MRKDTYMAKSLLMETRFMQQNLRKLRDNYFTHAYLFTSFVLKFGSTLLQIRIY